MKIVDSAESTAAEVARLVPNGSRGGSVRFFATDSVEKFRRAGEKFLGRKIDGVEHVDLER
jgi:glutamate racemase